MRFVGIKSYSIKAICVIDTQLREKLDLYKKLLERKKCENLDTTVEDVMIEKLEAEIEFIKFVLIDKYKSEDLKLHEITRMLKSSRGSNHQALEKVLVYRLVNHNELAELSSLTRAITSLSIDDIVMLANLAKNETVKCLAEDITHEYQESRYEEIERELSQELKDKIQSDEQERINESERRNKYVKYKRR